MSKIEELKAAFEAATSGEWEPDDNGLIYGRADEDDSAYLVCDMVGDPYYAVSEQDVKNAEFITLAHNLMPQLLEAVSLLSTARERFMRYECDGTLDTQGFVEEMQGILAGDVCSETLEALGELK